MFSLYLQYEGVIQEGNGNLVHHVEVFHCEVSADHPIIFYNGPGEAEGMPSELEFCRKVIGAWAMGASVSLFVLFTVSVFVLFTMRLCVLFSLRLFFCLL